jgi:hypothetical protein
MLDVPPEDVVLTFTTRTARRRLAESVVVVRYAVDASTESYAETLAAKIDGFATADVTASLSYYAALAGADVLAAAVVRSVSSATTRDADEEEEESGSGSSTNTTGVVVAAAVIGIIAVCFAVGILQRQNTIAVGARTIEVSTVELRTTRTSAEDEAIWAVVNEKSI